MKSKAEEAAVLQSGSRRRFVKQLALGSGATAAVVAARSSALEKLETQAASSQPPLPDRPDNPLIQMQADLDRALTRPPDTRSWVMVVDTLKCVGCNACSVACRSEVPVGPAGASRRVKKVFYNRTGVFKPANCMQCDNPPCAAAVPSGYIRKRPDGIVEFDYAWLRDEHARAAVRACPFGLAHIDDGKFFTDNTPAPQQYEAREFVENGQAWRRGGNSLLTGIARKCHFCSHLLEAGMLPSCVSTCIGGAMYFGDQNDERSAVAQLLRERRLMTLYTEIKRQMVDTRPRVFYVEDRLPGVLTTDCTVCHY